MTNFVEQMMKTAGCRKQIMCKWTCKGQEICNARCEHFKTKQDVFPPFTAEKQLELIKLLLSGLCDFTGYHGLCDKYHLCFGHTRAEHQDFTQALAQLTTELMNAGELDKEKVREVLEDAR